LCARLTVRPCSFLTILAFELKLEMSVTEGVKNLWDTAVQEAHGGQTWSQLGDKYVADFSVTTNGLGTPPKATQAAMDAMSLISHYPAADNGDAIQALSEFCKFPASQLLVGNGASEFIDIAMRLGPSGPFKPGPHSAAYKEYDRAAKVAGREVLAYTDDRKAGVTTLINPNSPTGDFLSLDQCDTIMAKAKEEGGIVLVDESFACYAGPDWHKTSCMNLIKKYPEVCIVIVSWTKVWACPGLRLGSVACSEDWYLRFKKNQCPWSCNTLAQAFFVSASRDLDFMEQSREFVAKQRPRQEELVKKLGWTVNEQSPAWVPYVWVDCGSAEVAEKAASVAHEAGCPVRWAASFGTPQHIRLGLRESAHQDILFQAWDKYFNK